MKDEICYFFFPKVLDATSSKNGLLVLRHVLSKLLFAHKEMCTCKRETEKQRQTDPGHWDGREEEMKEKSRKKRDSREKTKRKKNGGKESRSGESFFIIKFQPKEAVYTDSPFPPSEARRQTKTLCQL